MVNVIIVSFDFPAKVGIFLLFCLIAARAFLLRYLFAQSPQGRDRFALAQAARAFHFFVRTKKRNKEKRRLRSGAKAGKALLRRAHRFARGVDVHEILHYALLRSG